MLAEQVVRDDQRPAASADAPRPASGPIALPVAALPRGATPPIRARARPGEEPGVRANQPSAREFLVGQPSWRA